MHALWGLGRHSKPAVGTVLNWNAIIAFTEVVGAVAVLITLAYLAVQPSDNVCVMRSREVWDARDSLVEVNEVLGDGGAVSELM
ncbi:MAG: hypothetical protein ACI9WC_001141 [Arenicella sp.]|jgi:hypothetical protein